MVETLENLETMHGSNVDLGSFEVFEVFEEAAKRLRTRNELLLDGWNTTSAAVVDLYTGVASTMLDLREIMIETQLEWLSVVTSAQSLAIRQATQSKPARNLLA